MSSPDKYQGIDSIDRFCRQYLQLERELDYPAPTLLREQHVQEDLYRRVFSSSSDGGAAADGAPPLPPPRYQLRVLKELMKRIEASIDGDWEQYVCKTRTNAHREFQNIFYRTVSFVVLFRENRLRHILFVKSLGHQV